MIMIKVIAVDFGGVYFTWKNELFWRNIQKVRLGL